VVNRRASSAGSHRSVLRFSRQKTRFQRSERALFAAVIGSVLNDSRRSKMTTIDSTLGSADLLRKAGNPYGRKTLSQLLSTRRR